MSVYKEAMYLTTVIAKQQKQIYSDAADYGVPIFTIQDPAVLAVKQLTDFYGDESDKREVTKISEQQIQVVRELTMIDEFGDRKEFKIVLTFLKFTGKSSLVNSMHGKIIGVLSIDSPKWI